MSIRTKVYGALTIASLLVALLVSYQIKDLLCKKESASELLVLGDVAGQISSLVHELQKERGMSAGYLGSGGKKFKAELPQQHHKVDGQAKVLSELQSQADLKRAFPEIDKVILSAQKKIQSLQNHWRSKTLSQQAKVSEVVPHISSINNELLSVFSLLVHKAGDRSLSQKIQAYQAFLEGKERAGIERAVLSNAFASDSMNVQAYGKWIQLVSAQDLYLKQFKATATSEQLKIFKAKYQGDAVTGIDGFRQKAKGKNIDGEFGMDAATWFKHSSARINVLKAVDDELALDISQNAQKIYSQTQRGLLLLLFFSIVLAIVLLSVIIICRDNVRNFRFAQGSFERLANGDFGQKVEASDRKDEVGALLKTIDQTALTLSNIVGKMRAQGGKLDGAGEELVNFSQSLFGQAESLAKDSGSVEQATQGLSCNMNAISSATKQLSVNSNNVSSSAEQLSVNMNTVASAVEEMSLSIQQVAENSQSAAQVAEQAKEHSNQAQTDISELDQAASDIGNVTEVIKRIAEQTNLLALNATIEAASAGEAGKGFTVVANEIKELAGQCGKAAMDISQRIQGVQEHTQSTVSVMESITKIIEDISSSVESISESVHQQSSTTTEISNNVQEANAGASDITQSIVEISQASKDIASNVSEASNETEQVALAAKDLSQLAQQTSQDAQSVVTSSEALQASAATIRQSVANFSIRDDIEKTSDLFFNWNSQCPVGHDGVDRQHMQLVKLLNELHQAMLSKSSASKISQTFDGLISYTKEHLEFEENIYHNNNHPELPKHRDSHKKFVQSIVSARQSYERGELSTMGFLNLLKDWLNDHILKDDREMFQVMN